MVESIHLNYKIVVNDENVTQKVSEHFISLQVTDNDKDDSDEITLTLSAKFKRPSYQDKIKVFLGYENDLKFAGLYYVQTTNIRDNKQLTIRATGVDFNGDLKQRKSITYPPAVLSDETVTLAHVVKQIASRHGLESKTDLDIGKRFEQINESDLNFLNRLAKEYNAIFNIKNNTLYFMTKGGEVPKVTIDINRCYTSDITYSNKTLYKSCKAVYHNSKTNRKHEIVTGEGDPQLVKQGQWLNDDDAMTAAKNALTRANKSNVDGSLSTKGRLIFAGSQLTLDDNIYEVTQVTHDISKGWKTTVNFKDV